MADAKMSRIYAQNSRIIRKLQKNVKLRIYCQAARVYRQDGRGDQIITTHKHILIF